MEIKLPKECKSYEYGVGMRPEGSRLGYAVRIRLHNGTLRTSFFTDEAIRTLDSNPEKFYKRYAGIKKVMPSGRLRCWQNQKQKYRISIFG